MRRGGAKREGGGGGLKGGKKGEGEAAGFDLAQNDSAERIVTGCRLEVAVTVVRTITVGIK